MGVQGMEGRAPTAPDKGFKCHGLEVSALGMT